MHSKILRRVTHWSVLDSSGEYRVAAGVLRGTTSKSTDVNNSNDEINFEDIMKGKPITKGLTLVTQCSLAHLHMLPDLSEMWQGPISVAVFLLSGEIQIGIQTILQMSICFREVKANVTFSLIFPLSSPTAPPRLIPNFETLNCKQILSSVSPLGRQNYDFPLSPFPNNLLRNVARKAVGTEYILVLDIDMVPSNGLLHSFLNYVSDRSSFVASGQNRVEKTDDKTVWVVPAYELRDGAAVPHDKKSLLELKEKGLARPFYQELCWKCQKYTDYDAWEKQIDSKETALNSVKPLYEVFWRDPWEPFYISQANIPFYDERFRQYGFNRISQVCELHVAGYRFLVLDSAFVLHKGFKVPGSLHSSKDSELEKNRMIFRQFKVNLKEKYPDSSRRCY